MPGVTTVNRILTVFAAAAAMLLASCDGAEFAGIQGSGGPAPAAAVGPITGFGSIFVNGVEYVTSGAQILIDNSAGTEAQLHAGQIVTIKGTVNADGVTGTASEVTFSGDVQGPAVQIDLTDNTFVVLGQSVRVTGSTLFDPAIQPADLTGVQTGTVVEVSGFEDASGDLVASRVDLKTPGSNLRAKGTVEALDTASHTFRINSLLIDYSASFVPATLANGSLVEVQGTTLAASGELLANDLEVLPGLGAAANQHLDVEGIITTFTSASDFVVQGQHVVTDANTQLVLHGVTLGVNVVVDVQGSVNASGMLLAKKVEVRSASSALIRGLVDSVTATNNSLSVLGVQVTISSDTVLEDRSSQHVRLFRFSDVRAGDYVEIHGVASAPGTVAASVLERDNSENRSYLQGTALNVVAPSLSVLDVNVTTNAQTVFIGLGNTPASAAMFFSEAANQLVRVRGSFSGGVLTADHVQIE
jgi:Domain of unknown function (DUF5666)